MDTSIVNMGRLCTTSEQKVRYVCGDFNIYLLNPNKHKKTEEFTEVMYGMGLFPAISKPSRITADCASLIDKIFNMENS